MPKSIDATACVADGARIGDGVEVGPYCVVGSHVELKDGVRLIGQVNITGATTVAPVAARVLNDDRFAISNEKGSSARIRSGTPTGAVSTPRRG